MRVLLATSLLLPQLASAQIFEHRDAAPLRASVVRRYSLAAGAGGWQYLEAEKQRGARYRIWNHAGRYIVEEGSGPAREYRHAVTGEAVRPATLPWRLIWPEPSGRYLGHDYRQVSGNATFVPPPATARLIELRPDLLVGQAHNTRQKDETRRYDQSDYEYVPLTQDDYRAMAAAGINVVNVNTAQLPWADALGLYYWGSGGADLPFPEMLYRSQYLGPTIFLDEPAVHTRDFLLRPRLAKDPEFRRAITPQIALAEFEKYFDQALASGAPQAWRKSLARREDMALGDLALVQHNLYTWETMPETAAWQLGRDSRVPDAFVFEPPGRIGARRTLPELDMTYGVSFPPDAPQALTAVLFGFLRGAARATGKQWGVSIYGQVDRADAPVWLTHAYDLGATRFFFWSSYQLACVPFGEVLALSRHLTTHARQQPPRNLARLRAAGETAILLPPGYGLGHVQTGRGSLWGINELHLERTNRRGASHRAVMSAFFRAIERAWRAGEPFDLLWDLPGLRLDGYRRVERIPENPESPPPPGSAAAPRLNVTVESAALEVRARAEVEETAAPVWYTHGAATGGVHHNAAVLWELFGPDEEDYRFLVPDQLKPATRRTPTGWESSVTFQLDRPGRYRLRAATVDTAGRSTVVWRDIQAP